jgi:hypothetical protein
MTNTTNHAPAGIDLDLDKLEALARAATPGPWIADRAMIGRPNTAAVKQPGAFDWICSMQVSNQPNWDKDADFISSANPATVLALIALARRAAADAPAADEREAFETWMKSRPGYPFAGAFANLMWEAWQARAAHPIGQASPAIDQDFKNFHRLLCERFGYTHDERDWRRDQLSLIEHIAGRAAVSPDATGKAVDASAGGQSIDTQEFRDLAISWASKKYGVIKAGHKEAWESLVAHINTKQNQSPATSAADAMDAARFAWLEQHPTWRHRWRRKNGKEQWQMWHDGEPWGQWGDYRRVIDAAMVASRKDVDHG